MGTLIHADVPMDCSWSPSRRQAPPVRARVILTCHHAAGAVRGKEKQPAGTSTRKMEAPEVAPGRSRASGGKTLHRFAFRLTFHYPTGIHRPASMVRAFPMRAGITPDKDSDDAGHDPTDNAADNRRFWSLTGAMIPMKHARTSKAGTPFRSSEEQYPGLFSDLLDEQCAGTAKCTR